MADPHLVHAVIDEVTREVVNPGDASNDALRVNIVAASVSGSNPAASATGSPVPSMASYTGFMDDYGNLVGISSTNPLPVTFTATSTVGQTSLESIDEALMSSNGVQPEDARTLYDLLDSSHPQFVPLGTAPAGIDTTGRRPEAASFPVTLSDEQVLDLTTPFLGWGAGTRTLGKNCLDALGAAMDVSRFRSIAMQFEAPTGVSATITFEGSNNGTAWVAVPMFDAAASTTAPVTSVAVAAATNRFFEGPLKYKFFRARISTAVAGGVFGASARVSMAPYSPAVNQVANSAGNWSTNVAQWGGTALVAAGLAGVPAVGGNIAAGTAPTTNPVPLGGIDTQVVGTTRTITGKTRRLLTDELGNLTIVGPDPRNTGLDMNPVYVQTSPLAGNGEMTDSDALQSILKELRVTNFYLKELPLALASGTAFTDEPGQLVQDLSILN